VLAARDGARIVRVHDVADTVAALAVQRAIDEHREVEQQDHSPHDHAPQDQERHS
jgi:dihydropteroate synthase